jgi:hypothetical protein
VLAAWQDVPGVRTATVEDSGHSPNVEQPEETASLVLEFAADAGDEVLAPAPEAPGEPKAHKKKKGKPEQGQQNEHKPSGGGKPGGSKPGGGKPGGGKPGQGKPNGG